MDDLAEIRKLLGHTDVEQLESNLQKIPEPLNISELQ